MWTGSAGVHVGWSACWDATGPNPKPRATAVAMRVQAEAFSMLLPFFIAGLLQAAAPAAGAAADAIRDDAARQMLARARAARASQDSLLQSYDATAFQRASVGAGTVRLGRERTLFATETMGRVRWQRGRGAWLELQGGRHHGVTGDMTPPIPYYPGMEALWIEGGPLKATLQQFMLLHPLDEGSESEYTFQTGDSLRFVLPGGTAVRMRELRVRPRRASARLVVGSFWFVPETGQLIRAAYRPSAPLELLMRLDGERRRRSLPSAAGDALVKALVSPLRMQVTSIAIEYGLHEGAFWLPRSRVLTGTLDASVMRGFVRLEQRFRYASVNGADTIPPIPADPLVVDTDTFPASRKELAVAGLLGDSAAACLRGSHYTVTHRTKESPEVPLAMAVPCDLTSLRDFPGLPPSIFEAGDDPGAQEREKLIASALSMEAQPPFGRLPPPVLGYGLSWTRFNRVEGLSTGAQVDQGLGGGFAVRVLGRLGSADRTPNVELSVVRGNARDSTRLGMYTRLVSANDWGDPLAFTGLPAAVLLGQDDGFYYRAAGVELGGGGRAAFALGADVEWRVFIERERAATQQLATAPTGTRFAPNVVARAGEFAGARTRLVRTWGQDPRHFRAFGDLRMEAATGEATYGRFSAEFTASQRFGALTLSGGTSAGALPPQRRWFLGGSHTVRGQSADTSSSGTAYWLLRAELAPPSPVRLSPFVDLGWAGDRSRLGDIGRPMSGAGVGLSLFDGLARIDLARGFHPRQQRRLHVYLGGRF